MLFNLKPSLVCASLRTLQLVAHTHRLWFKLKSAVELSTIVAGYRPAKFLSKPMSGFFAVVLALHACKVVKMYGFSPYQVGGGGSTGAAHLIPYF